ncbi:MAG TPA: peptidoglycan DD-metalloendopeptidase family protein [Stellaceae bacterium]|nr:peptidoglycan DD-metalloendopeptidase family protein [Stellaceae bacterium]
MITTMLRWGGTRLPDKPFVARFSSRASDFMQHRRPSAAMTAATALGAVVLLGAGYFYYSGRVASERAAAEKAETANTALQDELGRLRNQLGAEQGRLATQLAEAQARQQQRSEVEHKLAATEASSTSRADRIAQLTRALDQAHRELHLTEAQRVTLVARLSKTEADLAAQQAQNTQALNTAGQSQRRLQQLQTERDRLAAERDALKGRLNQLERRSSMARPQAAPSTRPAVAAVVPMPTPAPARRAVADAVVAPIPAPAPARPAVVAAVAAPAPAPIPARPEVRTAAIVVPRAAGRGTVGQVERVLASAGVDVAHLFSQFGVTRGEGGPFVPVPRGGLPPSALTPQKLAALRIMMKSLPVSAPLTSYRIGSPFGIRHDPMNGRGEFHTGIDFDAPYESPVYATGAGVVTYAGYRNDYGKIVEIDHGHGISTRYAHLHRFTVSVGEHVAAHQQIGLLGSTGRATGPHVHYEVLVNGEPQDPEKFMRLSHIVPVSAQR